MRIPDHAKNSVCFLATKEDGEFKYIGTGSFVVYSGKSNGMYLVTAKHLISLFMEHSYDLWICFSDAKGRFQSKNLGTDDWHYHSDKSVDAAVFEFEWDFFNGIPMIYLFSTAMADRHSFSELAVGIGDETITIGLYTPSAGGEGTGLEPIARSGIIASVPKHKIPHTGRHGLVGSYEAILVEMRSIKGLSGSPVITVLGDQHFKVVGKAKPSSDWNDTGGDFVMVVGVISGHFKEDTEALQGIAKVLADTEFGTVNTGIAFVTPMWKVREIIESGELLKRALSRNPMPVELISPGRLVGDNPD